MNIDRNAIIAGIPIITVRNFLRDFRRYGSFSLQAMIKHFSLEPQSCAYLLKELIACGYIEENSLNKYEVTVKGNALAQTKFVSRMNKAKADKIFGDFMKRVEKINEDDSYVYRVSKLILFGSYLNSAANDYGDIDIAYELKPKMCYFKTFNEVCQSIIDNAKENGKRFYSYLDEICYPETLVLQYLKSRSPYISLHRPEEIRILAAPHKQIFPKLKHL